jgi:hypothetical protein
MTLSSADPIREALESFIYETTHLSPERPDGSHDCRISKETLTKGREALPLLTTKASDDGLVEALDAAEALCNFAYRQGYHELGYDPIKVIRAAISSMPTIADEGERARIVAALTKWSDEPVEPSSYDYGKRDGFLEAARRIERVEHLQSSASASVGEG